MSVVECERPMDWRSVRQRLRNPPNGKHEISEQEHRQVLQDNDKLREQLKHALEQLAVAHITIENQAESFANLKSLPLADRARPAELAVGLKHFQMRNIVAAASEHCGISVKELMSARRLKHLVYARQLCYFVAKEVTTLSISAIGRRMGRDHTTILFGISKVEARLPTDERLRSDIESVKARLNA